VRAGSLALKPPGADDTPSSIRIACFCCVAEKGDITTPELASDLEAARGTRADPASLSRAPDVQLNPYPAAAK
jgi:hypothetical protein